jgi:hypothetical protein
MVHTYPVGNLIQCGREEEREKGVWNRIEKRGRERVGSNVRVRERWEGKG